MQPPGAREQAQSISWPDGIKGDLNQALDLLGLFLLIRCLGLLCVLSLGCSCVCVASTSPVIGWEDCLQNDLHV